MPEENNAVPDDLQSGICDNADTLNDKYKILIINYARSEVDRILKEVKTAVFILLIGFSAITGSIGVIVYNEMKETLESGRESVKITQESSKKFETTANEYAKSVSDFDEVMEIKLKLLEETHILFLNIKDQHNALFDELTEIRPDVNDLLIELNRVIQEQGNTVD